jgi:hypothetical protein
MVHKQRNEGTAVSEKPSAKRDDPKQSERFLEAAREHQAATTEEEARRVFRKVAAPRKAGKKG